jgi:hypothetical protein
MDGDGESGASSNNDAAAWRVKREGLRGGVQLYSGGEVGSRRERACWRSAGERQRRFVGDVETTTAWMQGTMEAVDRTVKKWVTSAGGAAQHGQSGGGELAAGIRVSASER